MLVNKCLEQSVNLLLMLLAHQPRTASVQWRIDLAARAVLAKVIMQLPVGPGHPPAYGTFAGLKKPRPLQIHGRPSARMVGAPPGVSPGDIAG